MKSKVKYSTYSIAVTFITFLALFVGCMVTMHDKPAFLILLPVFILLTFCGCLFGPYYIQADPQKLTMRSLLRSKKLAIESIESIELLQPTMGAKRITGSGGFMGYWGLFREGDIGRYYAFYGKASDCFLVKMKNGDKYLLGCENPQAFVDYVKSLLPK